MGTTHLFLLSAFICFTTEVPYPKTGLVLLRNRRNVKTRAELRSCARHNCSKTACPNEDGWHLYGSDWGCCGNYEGCCTWASVICFAHDVICQCCDYGWWCGPECRPEPECFLPGRKVPNLYEGLDHSVVNEIPDSMPQKGNQRNVNGPAHKSSQEGQHKSEQSNDIPKERFTFSKNIDNNLRTREGSAIGNVSEIIEPFASNEINETERDFYAQHMMQKLNYSNDNKDNASFADDYDTGQTSTDNRNDSIGNATQYAINETSHAIDQLEKNETSQTQSHKVIKTDQTAKHSDERLLNSSLETIGEEEEAYDTINRTTMTNITGQDGDYNSTIIKSQTYGDNGITEGSKLGATGNDNTEDTNSDTGDTDSETGDTVSRTGDTDSETGDTVSRTGDTDSEDLFQSFIHVARMSLSSSEVPDPEQESVVEEDGSGAL